MVDSKRISIIDFVLHWQIEGIMMIPNYGSVHVLPVNSIFFTISVSLNNIFVVQMNTSNAICDYSMDIHLVRRSMGLVAS